MTKSTKSRLKKHKNYSLAVDLISSIGNEAMVDILLVANDGGKIPASRFVLGARSTVLQRMLFQEKDQADSGEMKLDYSTDVVRCLVHYCRTNELLDQIWAHAKDEAAARELIRLSNCANSLELEGLQELVCNTLEALTRSHPHLSCAIYDEAATLGEAVDAPKYIALGAIRQNPAAALLRRNEFGNREPGVSSLSSEVIEEIISDPRMNTEEITMFKAVAVWAEAPHVGDGTNLLTAQHLQEHRALAKQITARCINLSNVAPSQLLGIVNESGLVDAREISNALINLALRVEKEGYAVSKHRAQASGNGRPTVGKKNSGETLARPIEGNTDNSIVEMVPDDMSMETLSTAEAERSASSVCSVRQEQPIDSNKRLGKMKSKSAVITPQKAETKKPPTLPQQQARSQGIARPTRPSNIRQAIGLYLAEKVDTMCVHPSGGTHEDMTMETGE